MADGPSGWNMVQKYPDWIRFNVIDFVVSLFLEKAFPFYDFFVMYSTQCKMQRLRNAYA